MRRRAWPLMGVLLALTSALGCEPIDPDLAAGAWATVNAPGPETRGDWERVENPGARTCRRGPRGRHRCVERDHYFEGTLCFTLEPGDRCNETTVQIGASETQTVSSGFTLALPLVGNVTSSESVSYTTSVAATVPGRDCHHCWLQVCYATVVQPLDCSHGSRTWVEHDVEYTAPTLSGQPVCTSTPSECRCADGGIDGGADASVDGGEDAGGDAGADAGRPADAGPDDGGGRDAGADGGECSIEDGGADAGGRA